MEWLEKYGEENKPTFAQMEAYVSSPLWMELNTHLQQAYQAPPKQAFSKCSGQPGWNVKYAKGGKSLCTLYPMKGYFIALVVVGQKEKADAELLLPACTPYVQEVYEKAGALMGAKWLMIEMTGEDILEDVKRLIDIRRKAK